MRLVSRVIGQRVTKSFDRCSLSRVIALQEGILMDDEAFAAVFRCVRVLGSTAGRQRGFVAFRGEAIQFDSSLEYAFLRRIAADPSIIAIVSQPCRIPWLDIDGRWRSYVPDYAILLKPTAGGREAWVVELKMAHIVKRLSPRDRRKYVATKDWAEERGARIAIVTSEEIDKGLDKGSLFWAGHLNRLKRKIPWSDNSNSLKDNTTIGASAQMMQCETIRSPFATVKLSNASVAAVYRHATQALDAQHMLCHAAEHTEDILSNEDRCQLRRT